MNKTLWTEEKILNTFLELTQSGHKLTKITLDEIDPNIYKKAVSLYGTWMHAKRAFYEYKEKVNNPINSMQGLVYKNIEKIESEENVKFVVNNAINPEFLKLVENKDKYEFLNLTISNLFGTWQNFYKEYSNYTEKMQLNMSDKEFLNELTEVLSMEEVLEEHVISEKYKEVYNIAHKKYGGLTNAVVYFLEQMR